MSDEQAEDEEESPITLKRILIIFGCILLITVVLGVAPLVLTMAVGFGNVPSEAGLIGDSFGMVNAVLSGLAFAGVIITLFLQRHELELQRKDLRLAREAQQKSERHLKQQADLMFVSSYLSLLDMEINKPKLDDDMDSLFDGRNELHLESTIIMDRLKKENEEAMARLAGDYESYVMDRVSKSFSQTDSYARTLKRQVDDGVIDDDKEAASDGQFMFGMIASTAEKVFNIMQVAPKDDFKELHETLLFLHLHMQKVLTVWRNEMEIRDVQHLSELLGVFFEQTRLFQKEISGWRDKADAQSSSS